MPRHKFYAKKAYLKGEKGYRAVMRLQEGHITIAKRLTKGSAYELAGRLQYDYEQWLKYGKETV